MLKKAIDGKVWNTYLAFCAKLLILLYAKYSSNWIYTDLRKLFEHFEWTDIVFLSSLEDLYDYIQAL